MPLTLQRLAAGSYDLLLDGDIVGSVVRGLSKSGDVLDWCAELLESAPPWPAPFSQEAHRFDTLEATVAWLGGANVEDSV